MQVFKMNFNEFRDIEFYLLQYEYLHKFLRGLTTYFKMYRPVTRTQVSPYSRTVYTGLYDRP